MNNSITIIGHVGQKPQTVSSEIQANKVVKFSVAVKRVLLQFGRRKDSLLDVDAWERLG